MIAVFTEYARRAASHAAAVAKVQSLEAKLMSEKRELAFRYKEDQRSVKLFEAKAGSAAKKDEAQRNYEKSYAMLLSIKADLASAVAERMLAEIRLQQSHLIAPIAGTILRIHARPGERVDKRNGVVDMANLKAMDVVAEVREQDISSLAKGEKVEVRIVGIKDPLLGTVEQVGFHVKNNSASDSVSNSGPGSGYGSDHESGHESGRGALYDQRVVEVRIAFSPEDSQKIHHFIGMQVSVRFLKK